jgi:hypothetical protein
MGRETYTVDDLRNALDGVDGDRTVRISSQGAIDDLVGVKTMLQWNNGESELILRLKGR